jgi:hypothetical protein
MKQVITTTTIDLTKISVDFQLKFDALDAVLLVTTGGLGYLARAADSRPKYTLRLTSTATLSTST